MTIPEFWECRTRLTVVLVGCAMFFVEAVAKTIFVAFPLIETLSAQSSLLIGYIAVKTYSGVKLGAQPSGDAEGK